MLQRNEFPDPMSVPLWKTGGTDPSQFCPVSHVPEKKERGQARLPGRRRAAVCHFGSGELPTVFEEPSRLREAVLICVPDGLNFQRSEDDFPQSRERREEEEARRDGGPG